MFNQCVVATRIMLKKVSGSFNLNVAMIFALAIINVLYKIKISENGFEVVMNLWNPAWMLLGPFMFFANQSLKENKPAVKSLWLHLLPFLIVLTFFIVTTQHTNYDHPWADTLFIYYQNSFFLIPVSLIGYAIPVISDTRSTETNLGSGYELLIVIAGLYLIIALLSILMYLCWGILHVDMGIDYRTFTYVLLILLSVFILRFFYLSNTAKVDKTVIEDAADNSYANSILTEEQAGPYVLQIQTHFEVTKAFLRPDLSLEVLSKELNIPKHYFSQIFNVHIGKGFYHFVADYRIGYAIQRLQSENGRLKMESLSYECGFNSKTSFNRYFKKITGYTPLEYVNQKPSITLLSR